MKKRIVLIAGVMAGLFSCGTPVQQQNQPEFIKVTAQPEVTNKVFIAEVSDKQGGSISFKINPAANPGGMSTKANTNGTPAKTDSDIDHYLAYLISNSVTTGYPAGGDPLGDAVAGPFNIPTTAATQTITFTNVPSSGANAYYVAVRARDSSNTDLIKDNNGSATAWTGTTAGDTLKVAVSTGNGVSVNASLQVSSTTAMTVTPQLLDAVGATIQTDVTPNAGSSTLPAIDAN